MDEKLIEISVIKSFIRVVKENDMYIYFRVGVKKDAITKAFFRNIRWPSSPFSELSSIDEIANELSNITDKMLANKDDKYEYVTMTINHLLHFFIEPHNVPLSTLTELGERIYALSCNKLFGDPIEEVVKEDATVKPLENELEQKAFFDKLFSNCQILGKAPFSELDDFTWTTVKNMDTERGYRLSSLKDTRI